MLLNDNPDVQRHVPARPARRSFATPWQRAAVAPQQYGEWGEVAAEMPPSAVAEFTGARSFSSPLTKWISSLQVSPTDTPVPAEQPRPAMQAQNSVARAQVALGDALKAKNPDVLGEDIFHQKGGLAAAYAPMFGGPQGQTAQQMVDEAQLNLNDAQRARRAHALGMDIQGPTRPDKIQDIGVPDTKQMTWDDYTALTPRQRAAVDFNTMLVQAVRKDTRMQDTYDQTPKEQKQYDALVTDTFGEGRGSETYAPETMSVLQQIGYKDNKADLDDFLGLRAAFTDKDVKNLPKVTGTDQLMAAVGTQTAGQELMAAKANVAVDTAQMERSIANGNAMLQSIRQMAVSDRAGMVEALGGVPGKAHAALGFQPPNYITNPATGQQEAGDLNTYFQDAFQHLAAANEDSGFTLARINERLSPSEFTAFTRYADTRSQNSQWYQEPLVSGQGKWRTADDFRSILGLDTEHPITGGTNRVVAPPQQQQAVVPQQQAVAPQQQQQVPQQQTTPPAGGSNNGYSY